MTRAALLLLLLAPATAACGGAPPDPPVVPEASTVFPAGGPYDHPDPSTAHPSPTAIAYVDPDEQAVADAEARAAPGGKRVLETAHAMIADGVVVVGSCWDWAEAVFTRAGGGSRSVFRGRQRGPWADPSVFRPGDWLYFVHTDGGGTHSAIFVGWQDEAAHVGLTASYAGGHNDEPARYGSYELTQVFRVVRMDDAIAAAK